ncbi:50S ribosomal protein L21 [Candidatus Margulisiibacteriota bacterium]
MFAIIETGSKQYVVEKGSVIDVELLGKKAGEAVTFKNVLLLSKNKKTDVGTPYVKGVTVEGKILSLGKSKKSVSFKFKNKTGYKRTKGHRQNFAQVKIDLIGSKEEK